MTQAPYGTWLSPITAKLLVQNSITLADVLVDPIDHSVLHIEKRPSEGGRVVIVDSKTGKDAFGPEWTAKTRVQEYGGGPACIYDGIIYFSHSDGRIYRLRPGGQPEAVTPERHVWRYADFKVHPIHHHLLVSILEDHTKDTPSEVVTRLVVINTTTREINTLVEGADFYAAPAFSPDGVYLAYQTWNHPFMPWQKSEIHVAKVHVSDRGNTVSLDKKKVLAWMDADVSVTYPKWLDDDTLIFLSDISGFNNPWVYTVSSDTSQPLLPTPLDQDFCLRWQLGTSVFDFFGNATIIFSAIKNGRHVLYYYSLTSQELLLLDTDLTVISAVRAVNGTDFALIGESRTTPSAILLFTVGSPGSSSCQIVRKNVLKLSTASTDLSREIISEAQPLTLGDRANLHVVFYSPRNPQYSSGRTSEKPPCIVNAHGGPTAMSGQGLNWLIQYFTSRGWAWLDVNYGGSCGYGRKYMDRLNTMWGITDVEDCVQATSTLASPPYSLIDPMRIAIRGQSAGGYTALRALCAYPHTFKAGCSNFGISDLKKLSDGTHKYESRYMEGLVGGTYEEIPHVYEERSPVNQAENIRAPLLILQGTADRVVPPEQADIIVNKIKAQGGQVKKIVFEGEGHGWTRAETIKTALEAEREFYEEVFGIGEA